MTQALWPSPPSSNSGTPANPGHRLGVQCHRLHLGRLRGPSRAIWLHHPRLPGRDYHEFGHVIGLDHPCFSPGFLADGTPLPRPVDNNGNPAPDCSSPNLPATVTGATMYVSVDSPSAEVELRSLSPDDMQGACDIYPYASTFACAAPTKAQASSGCSYAAQPERGAIVWVLAILALATIRRRR